jgi:hypothetical protein
MKNAIIHAKNAMEMEIEYIIIALHALIITFFNQKFQILQIVFLSVNITTIIHLSEIMNAQIIIIVPKK